MIHEELIMSINANTKWLGLPIRLTALYLSIIDLSIELSIYLSKNGTTCCLIRQMCIDGFFFSFFKVFRGSVGGGVRCIAKFDSSYIIQDIYALQVPLYNFLIVARFIPHVQ